VSFASITKKLLRRLRRSRRRPLDGHLDFGSTGERLAARALRRAGHRVLARNYRCPAGEIDLITADAGEFVFVEVKTRASDDRQDPLDTISPAKWRRVERAARYFLMSRATGDPPCRFDSVTVVWPADGKPNIEHTIDAYQPRRP
jgi:putative endonuclease